MEQIRIALIDEAGFPTEQEIDCEAFGLTFDGVPAGFYDVQVTLLDHGSPVSAIMGGSDIVVVEDMDTQVSVDIPASSIF